MIVTSNWEYVRTKKIYAIAQSENTIITKRNQQLHKTNCEISREVVNINIFYK